MAEIARDLGGYLLPMPTVLRKPQPGGATVSIRFMAKSLQSFDPEALTPVIEGRWLDGFDVENVFRGVKVPRPCSVPTRPLGGMLAKAEGDRLARLMADCTALDWPGIGVLIDWQQPEAVAKYTIGFLETL